MQTIYDLVTPKLVSERWYASIQDRQPYLGAGLYRQRKQLGIDLQYLKGKKPAVKPLQLSAFDAKVIPISREGLEKIYTEMPFFKNSKYVDEKQRQELNKVIAGGNKYYIDSIMNQIYDDQIQLLDNAAVTKEIMRMSLLTTGTISFANNGQGVTYDFGIPEANKVTPTAKWNNATSADPIKDIISWQDQIENSTGIRPNMLLMNGTTFNLMQNAEKVQKAIYAFANNVVTPTRADVLAYVEKATQCRVLVYNKGYNKDGETTLTKFVGDGVVVLFPEGTVGEFVYGTTPEESDLMSGATSAVVEIVDDGIAITGTKLTDPVNVETKVSMIALPTLDLPESIIIADVDGE